MVVCFYVKVVVVCEVGLLCEEIVVIDIFVGWVVEDGCICLGINLESLV